MQLLVIFAVVVSALAAPGNYGPVKKISIIRNSGLGGSLNGNRLDSYEDTTLSSVICGGGSVLRADGKCVLPTITRKIFSYVAPKRVYNYGPPPTIPKPKVNYNVVFARTPEGPKRQDPIVVPPSQQQTVLYVLSKDQKSQPPKVIQVPDQPRNPEVYYVNYNEGENTRLPGGIDLQSALSSANSNQGQFINSVVVSRSVREPYTISKKN